MSIQNFAKPYWEKQKLRIIENLKTLGRIDDPIQKGRVIPNEEALSIGLGRRLKMAVLFLDICGFSSRPSEELKEQELILHILNLFFSEIVRIAEDFGGTVEKNTGDGLMAYFEDSSANDLDGSEKAISSALTMFYATQNLINPILLENRVAPLNFRIGIDYGQVTIARLGAARRFNSIVAIGTAANVACKMLKFADPGEIVIGASVYNSLSSARKANCCIKAFKTGWVYRASNFPYPFYTYTTRWKNLE